MRHVLTLLIFLLAFPGERASAFSDNAGSGTESFTWTARGRALTKGIIQKYLDKQGSRILSLSLLLQHHEQRNSGNY
ncbi:MAG TPA: hypothetical protein VG796_10025 [Verrucomicrobiales bacterium]|jgi:hypothetical protein|nr:hypothetical protein [Verrucomicrobiales bacterium]